LEVQAPHRLKKVARGAHPQPRARWLQLRAWALANGEVVVAPLSPLMAALGFGKKVALAVVLWPGGPANLGWAQPALPWSVVAGLFLAIAGSCLRLGQVSP